MNAKDKAVLDAARKYASLLHFGNGTPRDVRQATIAIQDAALAAFPGGESASEVVRDVADLRDGETVLLWGEGWTVYVSSRGRVGLCHVGGRSGLDATLLPFAVAAGAVTRPPRPEPDPADVERLTALLREHGHDTGPYPEFARRLLRSGEVTLRGPS